MTRKISKTTSEQRPATMADAALMVAKLIKEASGLDSCSTILQRCPTCRHLTLAEPSRSVVFNGRVLVDVGRKVCFNTKCKASPAYEVIKDTTATVKDERKRIELT